MRKKHNKIEVKNGFVIMDVARNVTQEVFKVKCDKSILPLLEKHYWTMNPDCLSVNCTGREGKKQIRPTLHKLLVDSKYVEFINKDRLDIRKQNLRPSDRPVRQCRIGSYLKGNRHIIIGDIAIFMTCNKKSVETGYFITDSKDVDKVIQYTWYLNNHGHVHTYTRGGEHGSKGLYLHRLLMNAKPEDLPIDHINQIRIDNRKSNLRFCTVSQNCHNRKAGKMNTSGVVGVTRNGNLWMAHMKVRCNNLWKCFPTFAEAVAQRKQWEEQYNPSGLNNA